MSSSLLWTLAGTITHYASEAYMKSNEMMLKVIFLVLFIKTLFNMTSIYSLQQLCDAVIIMSITNLFLNLIQND